MAKVSVQMISSKEHKRHTVALLTTIYEYLSKCKKTKGCRKTQMHVEFVTVSISLCWDIRVVSPAAYQRVVQVLLLPRHLVRWTESRDVIL